MLGFGVRIDIGIAKTIKKSGVAMPEEYMSLLRIY